MKLLQALGRKLTYANVMATIAVFLALGGGAYALTIPRDSVGTAQIKDRGVKSVDLGKGSVNFQQLGVNSVDSLKVRDDSLKGDDIDESTFVCAKIPKVVCGPRATRR